MAVPVINSIDVNPAVVPVGGAAIITVDATDPDAGTVAISVTVTDSQGNETSGSGVINEPDPLTYAVTVDRGTVTQDPVNPAVWTWQDS